MSADALLLEVSLLEARMKMLLSMPMQPWEREIRVKALLATMKRKIDGWMTR
jgi:hypothetical protein